MTSWHSYPSIFSLGHSGAKELLLDPVLVEEKVDGSQFSFGIFGGEIKVRSKGQEMQVSHPEKMFDKAVETVLVLAGELKDGWTYRAEYLQKPKHNVLAYDRVPNHHLIVFDINTHEEGYLPYDEKAAECARIGLECVPRIYEGMVTGAPMVEGFLSQMSALGGRSVLGGQRIEGVVIKNYKRFTTANKVVMGKFVSEAFKEVHKTEWKLANPGKGDVMEMLRVKYRSESRWNKAVQHLREAGKLEDSPRDIGNLLKEVQADIQKECSSEIAQALSEWAMPNILRGSIMGFPEWYKKKLLERQFE